MTTEHYPAFRSYVFHNSTPPTFWWVILNWLFEGGDVTESAEKQDDLVLLVPDWSDLHKKPNWHPCSTNGEKISLVFQISIYSNDNNWSLSFGIFQCGAAFILSIETVSIVSNNSVHSQTFLINFNQTACSNHPHGMNSVLIKALLLHNPEQNENKTWRIRKGLQSPKLYIQPEKDRQLI